MDILSIKDKQIKELCQDLSAHVPVMTNNTEGLIQGVKAITQKCLLYSQENKVLKTRLVKQKKKAEFLQRFMMFLEKQGIAINKYFGEYRKGQHVKKTN